jgi:hypothetical protein
METGCFACRFYSGHICFYLFDYMIIGAQIQTLVE